MLISHCGIQNLLVQGVVVGARPEAVNAASLDIHLGRYLLEEIPCNSIEGIPPYRVISLSQRDPLTMRKADLEKNGPYRVISLSQRDPLTMRKVDLEKNGPYLLKPGHFILAQSEEMFNLPDNVSAEYKLKSSMARIAIDHANAGWCDAGWHGSVLTLELVNNSRHHAIVLTQGDGIGQMIFFQHEPVPAHASYATKGRYNGDKSTQGIRE
ncbi:hypothetical protein [Candidatus Accumulibacter vicinus]|uniref:Deoxycytidine triphosphate deaminase n=1 Tax=Candidatus Accumulibacter vicinus TaxID=2954382 RepID=A0A084Y2F0_9PROT|nr:hypothetical protein [Candidatus Accumulibacter vicinus]KFB68894.1 MAG: Deoxycytidine triphosphate deaminase [Candidatus Accumulibacter vicinus]